MALRILRGTAVPRLASKPVRCTALGALGAAAPRRLPTRAIVQRRFASLSRTSPCKTSHSVPRVAVRQSHRRRSEQKQDRGGRSGAVVCVAVGTALAMAVLEDAVSAEESADAMKLAALPIQELAQRDAPVPDGQEHQQMEPPPPDSFEAVQQQMVRVLQLGMEEVERERGHPDDGSYEYVMDAADRAIPLKPEAAEFMFLDRPASDILNLMGQDGLTVSLTLGRDLFSFAISPEDHDPEVDMEMAQQYMGESLSLFGTCTMGSRQAQGTIYSINTQWATLQQAHMFAGGVDSGGVSGRWMWNMPTASASAGFQLAEDSSRNAFEVNLKTIQNSFTGGVTAAMQGDMAFVTGNITRPLGDKMTVGAECMVSPLLPMSSLQLVGKYNLSPRDYGLVALNTMDAFHNAMIRFSYYKKVDPFWSCASNVMFNTEDGMTMLQLGHSLEHGLFRHSASVSFPQAQIKGVVSKRLDSSFPLQIGGFADANILTGEFVWGLSFEV